MKGFSEFITKLKLPVILFFAIISLISAFLFTKVGINYNLSTYLDKNSETRKALDIMETEFGLTGNMQVLVQNISKENATALSEKLSKIDSIVNVNFDAENSGSYTNNMALFVILTEGDEYSESAGKVLSDVKSTVLNSGYEAEYAGSIVEKDYLRNSISSEMPGMLAISIVIALIILMIVAKSYVEPFIFLIVAGIGVIINLGSNIMFGEISYITQSVAAILQLALSIDYGICLLNSYHKHQLTVSDNREAMIGAMCECLRPVSCSALTTVAGLLALIFMSFTIGFDIGIVLMKGIVISALVSFTLLPATILFLDKLMKKTQKKPLHIPAKPVSAFAGKFNKVVAILSVVAILGGFLMQLKNVYQYSDTGTSSQNIIENFGHNNSMVVIFENGNNINERQEQFANAVKEFTLSDGTKPFTSYTAYTNTVLEIYDVEKASAKMNMDETDVELLYAMYSLLDNPDAVKLTKMQFMELVKGLADTDKDVKDFIDSSVIDTINLINTLCDFTDADYTASELSKTLTKDPFNKYGSVDYDSIKQIYGNKALSNGSIKMAPVDFETIVDYIVSASKTKPILKSAMSKKEISDLSDLSGGIDQYKEKMDVYKDIIKRDVNSQEFFNILTQQFGAGMGTGDIWSLIGSFFTMVNLYPSYFASIGQTYTGTETVNFLTMLNYLCNSEQFSASVTDEQRASVAELNAAATVMDTIYGSHEMKNLPSALSKVATFFLGTETKVEISNDKLEQIYIMYCNDNGKTPDFKMSGMDFATYVKSLYDSNAFIKTQINEDIILGLDDIKTVYTEMNDETAYTYMDMYNALNAVKEKINTEVEFPDPSSDVLSGVYLKYMVQNDLVMHKAIIARDLLHFINNNLENDLIKAKITDKERDLLDKNTAADAKAEKLFKSDGYSRLIVSVNLPNESESSFEFAEFITSAAKKYLGENAYVAGEIVSTYDMMNSFKTDNKIINIVTFVSIFLIVLLTFLSLSIPTFLTLIIEGAVWLGMAISFINGSSIFFMSYIIATCILMGATIDYGILVVSTYIEARKTKDKKESILEALNTAMPTIFSSGLILIACGFVIYFISSHVSIYTVGLLLGRGALISVLMVLFVLPSILYLCDRIIIKKKYRKQ